jgi:hypothetical protein
MRIPAPSRRSFLGAGAAVAVWMLGHAAGHRPMQTPPEAPLGPAQQHTLICAFEALLPPEANPEEIALGFARHMAAGDPAVAEELGVALMVLEHLGGTGPVSFSRFSRQSLEERYHVLEAWRRSSMGVKRQIYQGIRQAALFSWYTRPSTWEAIGYDGPWVNP